jgi:hypothetical protein
MVGTEKSILRFRYELKNGRTVTFIVPVGSKCDFGNVIKYDSYKELEKLIP